MRVSHRLLAAVTLLTTAVAAEGQPIDTSSGAVLDAPQMELGSLLARSSRVEADDWDRVTRLKPGTRVRVHLEPAGRKLGAVVRADDRELTLLVGNVHEIIARDRIRRIDVDRALARAAPWIGMAMGGVIMALELRGVGEDLTALGHAMWFGIGAGIGVTGGAVVRRATRFGPLYPPPPRVRFVYASASTDSTGRAAWICEPREESRVRKRPADASILRWNECVDFAMSSRTSQKELRSARP